MRNIFANCLFFLSCGLLSQASAQEEYHQTVIKEGIQVDFLLTHVDDSKPIGEFHEGDDVKFSFLISDTITKKPLSGAFPAGWMDKVNTKNPTDCGRKIISYIEGGLLTRPELDLNVYYVLTLNNDNTINVVDPLFGFGGSQLLAQIQLPGNSYDWAIREDQMTFYVSMPEVSQIAFINTSDMLVSNIVNIPGQPKHVVLQEDEHYLWATYDLQGNFETASGVAIIDTEKKELVKTIETGKGPHEIIMSDDNRLAFVSNQQSGTVSVIDIHELKVLKEVQLEDKPVSMAYSSKAKALYVVNEKNATISVIDANRFDVIATIPAEIGINKIDFTPNGRLGFVLNPEKNTVDIIDVAVNQIVQTADVEDQPDAVNFTDELAYIRHRGSEVIWMIPLDVVGRKGAPVPLIDFSGGQYPPALGSSECPADGIVQAPGANAILLSNYKDQAIYYYSEGMAAPSGQFNTYGKFPKAVQVVDKSIEEVAAGRYETTVKLRTPGEYDVSLFIDVPSLMECFPVTVLPSKEKETERLKKAFGQVTIKYLAADKRPVVGQDAKYRFSLMDLDTKLPVTDLKDVRIMSMSSYGTNHHPLVVKESNTVGVYEANLKFEEEGLFYLYVECLSRGLRYNNPQFLVVYASEQQTN